MEAQNTDKKVEPVERTENAVSQPDIVEFQASRSINWYISSFTEEILGFIGTYAGLEAVMRLHRTGSLVLRQKLSSPRCHIDLHVSGLVGFIWHRLPSEICQLKGIRGISLVPGQKSGFLPSVAELNWSDLPSTLESIHYTHESASKLLDLLASPTFPNLTSLSILDLRIGSNLNLKALRHENARNLRYLRIKKPALWSQRLARDSFPRALRTLSLPNFNDTFPMTIVSSLPHLEMLDLPHVHTLEVDLLCGPFPQSLTSLNILALVHLVPLGVNYATQKPSEAEEAHLIRFFFSRFSSLSSLRLTCVLALNWISSTKEMGLPAYWDHLKHLEVKQIGMSQKLNFPLPSRLTSLTAPFPHSMIQMLPTSLLQLSLPRAELPLSGYSQLPPKLSILTISSWPSYREIQNHLTHSSFDLKDPTPQSSSENEEKLVIPLETPRTLSMPSSLTHLASLRAWNSTGHDLPMLKILPRSVLVFDSCSLVYLRITPRKGLHLDQRYYSGLDGTGFADVNYAIMNDDLEMMDHFVSEWNQAGKIDIFNQMMSAVKRGALDTFRWLNRQLTDFLRSGFFDPEKGYLFDQLAWACLSLDQTLRIKFLDQLARGVGGMTKIHNMSDFLHSVIEKQDFALIKWFHARISSGKKFEKEDPMRLTAAMAPVNYSHEIVDFLLQEDARSVNLEYIVHYCLRDRSIERLEHLKTLSKQWPLISQENWFRLNLASLDSDWSYLPSLMNWIKNSIPILNIANHPNEISMDLLWASQIHHIVDTILVTFGRLAPKNLDARYSNLRMRELNINTWDAPNTEKSGLWRSFTSSVIALAKYFSSQGVDIFYAIDHRQMVSIFDVAVMTNSVELLEFLASLPGDGLLAALLNRHPNGRQSIQKEAKHQMPAPQNLEELVTDIAEIALSCWDASQETYIAIRVLSSHLNIMPKNIPPRGALHKLKLDLSNLALQITSSDPLFVDSIHLKSVTSVTEAEPTIDDQNASNEDSFSKLDSIPSTFGSSLPATKKRPATNFTSPGGGGGGAVKFGTGKAFSFGHFNSPSFGAGATFGAKSTSTSEASSNANITTMSRPSGGFGGKKSATIFGSVPKPN